MKRSALAGLILVFGLLMAAAAGAAELEVLHAFSRGDGKYSYTKPLVSGGVVYGMTQEGGAYNLGLIYSMNLDGTDHEVLHHFSGQAGDTKKPVRELLLLDGKLYGTTMYGGAENVGAIFRIETDGSNFEVIRYFSLIDGKGHLPLCALAVKDGVLYGTASAGGANGEGVVFKINPDGTGYEIIFDFSEATGTVPYASVAVDGDTLYGTTRTGGDHGKGTLYKVGAGGSGFEVLVHFGDGIQGTSKSCPVLQDGKVYLYNGSTGDGQLFRVNTGGGEPEVLHRFPAGNGDGRLSANGALTIDGDVIYGATGIGGENGVGTLFKINIDGSRYRLLHSFSPEGSGGHTVYANPALADGKLIGVTFYGGDYRNGTIFAYPVPEEGDYIPGDLDGDGSVTSADLPGFRTAMGTATGDAGYRVEADMNGDGSVDRTDLRLFMRAIRGR